MSQQLNEESEVSEKSLRRSQVDSPAESNMVCVYVGPCGCCQHILQSLDILTLNELSFCQKITFSMAENS